MDHVDGRAAGGRDYPAVMFALCPNCHRNKTHGAERGQLTEQLRKEAARLYSPLSQRP
ncbi:MULTISPECIES: HNH endonuclease signature motif containing protein [unclassified Streptomyces]|uniref:HNH endonuclease signature motif containing protein n=1 Tax=unclassified Streptomyces TaxID=2593676 RepID=UPI0033CB02A4